MDAGYIAGPDTKDVIHVARPRVYVSGMGAGSEYFFFQIVEVYFCDQRREWATHREAIWKLISCITEITEIFGYTMR